MRGRPAAEVALDCYAQVGGLQGEFAEALLRGVLLVEVAELGEFGVEGRAVAEAS